MADVGEIATLSIAIKRGDVPRTTADLDKLSAASTRAEQATGRLGVSSVAATKNMNAWTALQAESAGHVGNHSLAIGRLERALAGIVGHFVGANAAMELLGSGILKFTVGTLETAGVLGGLALLVGLYEKMTEGMRAAKKQMDDMTDSLVKQAAAAHQATVEGLKQLELIAQVNQQKVQAESGLGWRSILGSVLTGKPFISDKDAERQSGRLANAQTAVDQTAANTWEKMQKDAEEAARKAEEAERKRLSAAEKRARLEEQLAEYAAREVNEFEAIFAKSRGTLTSMSPTYKALGLTDKGQVDLPASSMPNVGVWDGVTKAQQRHIEKVQQLNEEYARAKDVFKSTDSAIEDFKAGIKQAATGLLLQLSPGNIAQGLINGAVHMVDGAIHSLVGTAVTGIRHALFGSSGAERAAAREAAENARASRLNLDAIKASLAGDTLKGGLIGAQLNLISVLSSINSALPGKANERERNQQRAEATALELQQEAKLRQQDAEQKQYATEDLAVRNLKALGRGDEADLLGFKNQQAREMTAAMDANKDATYLLYLATVQGNELQAYMNGLLSTSLRNSPNGFFLGSYVGDFITGRPPNYPTDSGESGKSAPTGGKKEPIVIYLQVDGKTLSTAYIDQLDRKAASTGGAGSSRAAALELM